MGGDLITSPAHHSLPLVRGYIHAFKPQGWQVVATHYSISFEVVQSMKHENESACALI